MLEEHNNSIERVIDNYNTLVDEWKENVKQKKFEALQANKRRKH